ncbi:MAG: winged helix-turn-helix domain-containing protein [Bryobacteraceae bacterium]
MTLMGPEDRVVRFGVFELNAPAGELRKNGFRLKLAEQPFRILEHLAEHPGEIVTREDLRDLLWGQDTFVDFEHGLNAAINKLREVLDDSAANPRFIETVPRRGYRFIARVEQPVQAQPVQPPTPTPAAPPPARNRLGWWIAGAGVVAAAIAGFLLFRQRPTETHYELRQLTRDSGLTFQPGISADGNFVVYASDRATGKDLDIWIQHVSGGQPFRLTSSPTHESIPSISADGRRVVFQLGYWGEEKGIFVVPALGGTPQMVTPAGRDARISPDGSVIAYSTGDYGQPSEVRLIPAEGGSDRKISAGLDWAIAPAWTRQGKHLLVWARRMPNEPLDYWMVPATGGAATKTGITKRLGRVGVKSALGAPFSITPSPVASVADDQLVIAARSGDGVDLWLSPLSEGNGTSQPVRITVGAGAANPSVAANGRIAFARLVVDSSLWMLPLEPSSGRVTGEMRRVLRENISVNSPNVSDDGRRLAYVSNRGGDPDVWIRDLDTGVDRQVTASKANEGRAVISPDGAHVAFGLSGDFYTIPSSGGVQKLACKGCGPNVVAWTPDGGKLLYYYFALNPPRHATVDLSSGTKRDILSHPTAVPQSCRISPDGRWLTFTLTDTGSRVVYVAAFEDGGKPESWIRISGEGQANDSFWSTDGNLLYIHQADTLWARKLRPGVKTPMGDPFVVQRFDGPRYRPRFSAKGFAKNALYFTMEETRGNVWLAEPVAQSIPSPAR